MFWFGTMHSGYKRHEISTFKRMINNVVRKSLMECPLVHSANFPECIQSCTLDERFDKIAGCAYICEMTHGYESREFLDTIGCLVESECLVDYPRDGVCLGEDKDGLQNIKSLEQVTFLQSLHTRSMVYMEADGEKRTDALLWRVAQPLAD